jgi:hypothetical protein
MLFLLSVYIRDWTYAAGAQLCLIHSAHESLYLHWIGWRSVGIQCCFIPNPGAEAMALTAFTGWMDGRTGALCALL